MKGEKTLYIEPAQDTEKDDREFVATRDLSKK